MSFERAHFDDTVSEIFCTEIAPKVSQSNDFVRDKEKISDQRLSASHKIRGNMFL